MNPPLLEGQICGGIVKGAGEAGNVGALPAVGNALVDALAPLGIRQIEMPATPERLWRAMRSAPSR